MKTPINGGAIFFIWNEKHPILVITKCIEELTLLPKWPIMASGSGTITRARWCGGGNRAAQNTTPHMKQHMKKKISHVNKEGKS